MVQDEINSVRVLLYTSNVLLSTFRDISFHLYLLIESKCLIDFFLQGVSDVSDDTSWVSGGARLEGLGRGHHLSAVQIPLLYYSVEECYRNKYEENFM